MYSICRSTTPKSYVVLTKNYKTFGQAKKGLIDLYNKLMWSGNICFWQNNICFKGTIEGIETTLFIKKN